MHVVVNYHCRYRVGDRLPAARQRDQRLACRHAGSAIDLQSQSQPPTECLQLVRNWSRRKNDPTQVAPVAPGTLIQQRRKNNKTSRRRSLPAG